MAPSRASPIRGIPPRIERPSARRPRAAFEDVAGHAERQLVLAHEDPDAALAREQLGLVVPRVEAAGPRRKHHQEGRQKSHLGKALVKFENLVYKYASNH